MQKETSRSTVTNENTEIYEIGERGARKALKIKNVENEFVVWERTFSYMAS